MSEFHRQKESELQMLADREREYALAAEKLRKEELIKNQEKLMIRSDINKLKDLKKQELKDIQRAEQLKCVCIFLINFN